MADGSIYRPIVALNDGRQFSAGTAFAVEDRDHVLILTAQHIFGPDGGLEVAIPATELPNSVSALGLLDVYSEKEVVASSRALSIPDAAPLKAGWDVAAFSGDSADLLPLTDPINSVRTLSWGDDAKVGDYVCVAAQSGADLTKRAFAARVVQSGDGGLIYEFLVPFDPQATSGAPVLALNGDVVGTNIGVGTRSGKPVGIGNQAGALRERIASIRWP